MASVNLDDPRAAAILGWMADHLRRFPNEFEAAKIVTLNRIGVTLNKEAIRILTSRYAAKRADIARKIAVTKASSGNPFVLIRGEGRPIHLGLWPGRKRAVRKDGRTYWGWGAKILNSGGGRKIVKGGFGQISGLNQEFVILKRRGRQRTPTHGLYGPSMIGHLTKDERLEPLIIMGRNSLETELIRQAQFRLGRLGVL